VQERAALALGRIGGEVVGPLGEALDDATGAGREALLVALGRSGEPSAVPVLREAAGEADTEELQTIAAALAWIDHPAAEKTLRATLRQGGAELREELARSVGRLEVSPLWLAVEPAQRLLSDDPAVQQRLVAALAEMMGDRELRELVERLPEMGEFEWEVTAWILEEAVTDRAVGILTEVLAAGQPEAARDAARILAALGTREALDALRQSLSGEDLETRAYAASSLNWAAALDHWMPEDELASDDPQTRAGGAILLAYAGHAEAIERLIDLLADQHPGVRTYAAWGLGMVGADAADALEPLARQAESDPDPHARKQAAASLETIRAESANTQE
jgi:HEAT repeat protein